VRRHLTPSYSCTGRPSTNPKLLVRMLLVGYRYGIRSERQLCEEVELNLAYRWFCRLGLDSEVRDHSTFSKNRQGHFRDSDLLRKLFETVVNSLALLAMLAEKSGVEATITVSLEILAIASRSAVA